MDSNVVAKKVPEIKDGSQIDVMPLTEGTAPPAKKYVPEGYKSAVDFLNEMRKEYQADIDYDRLNRVAALDDKKFAAGEQWDPIVLEQRKGLPCLVINSIPQFTAQLVGDWRESRKAIKVLATNDEDVDIASIRADMIRAIEVQSRADRVYDSSFESLVQCGDGAFRVAVEYARDDVFDQDIFIRPIEDVHATVWDRFSVDPTGRDAKRVFVDDRMPISEFKRKYPGIDPSDLIDDSNDLQSWNVEGWIDQESYRVTEYWRLIQRRRLIALFGNGKIFEIDSENQESLIQQYGNPVRTRIAWCSYAQMHLVTAFAILEGPFEYRLNRLPIIRMSGRVVNVGGRRVRYGLVRFMKDAARLKNFWRSVAAEQLGYAPKAQWMATESAVEGREDKIRAAHLSRDPLLVFNDEAVFGQNVQRMDPPVMQDALLNESAINTQDMKDVTGIHDASLGVRSNETSGRAIMARQKEGDIASLTFYDNGNAAVLEAGDVINQLIPQVIDGTRTVLTIGEDQAPKLMRVNDPMIPGSPDLSVGMFQVTLATGTSYSTRRQEGFQALMDMVQVAPQIAQIAGDLIAKNGDFPGAEELAKRLKKTVPPQFLEDDDPDKANAQQFTPEQIAEFQQKMMELETENRELKADTTLKFKELEIKSYDAVTKRIAALSDDAVDGENPHEIAALNMLLDTAHKIDEHELKTADTLMKHNLEREKLAQASVEADKNRQLSEKTAASKATPSTPKSKSTAPKK
jgi:hypothetical protein